MKKNNIYFSLSDISTIVNISRKIDSLTANIQHDREKDNDISFQSNSTNEYENIDTLKKKMLNFVHNKFNLRNSNDYIGPKLTDHKLFIYQNNNDGLIKNNEYDKLFIFGDIHSDIKVFLLTLLSHNIIEFYRGEMCVGVAEKNSRIIDDIKKCGIESIEYYLTQYSIRFKYERSCLILLGDIVDGRRKICHIEKSVHPVFVFEIESNGINELLIHIILCNLRANSAGSRVLLLWGNHDLTLATSPEISTDYCESYDETVNNYVDINTINILEPYRRNILLPFYLIDSGLFVIISDNNNSAEYVLSHGSVNRTFIEEFIRRFENKCDHVKINMFTNEINNVINMAMYEEYNDNNQWNDLLKNFINPFTWSRNMFEKIYETNIDDYINNELRFGMFANTIFIMGHQPTYTLHKAFVINDEEYNTICRNDVSNHCIFPICLTNNRPKFIFADIGMSNSINRYGTHTVPRLKNKLKIKKGVSYEVKNDYTNSTEILMLLRSKTNKLDIYIARAIFNTFWCHRYNFLSRKWEDINTYGMVDKNTSCDIDEIEIIHFAKDIGWLYNCDVNVNETRYFILCGDNILFPEKKEVYNPLRYTNIWASLGPVAIPTEHEYLIKYPLIKNKKK